MNTPVAVPATTLIVIESVAAGANTVGKLIPGGSLKTKADPTLHIAELMVTGRPPVLVRSKLRDAAVPAWIGTVEVRATHELRSADAHVECDAEIRLGWVVAEHAPLSREDVAWLDGSAGAGMDGDLVPVAGDDRDNAIGVSGGHPDGPHRILQVSARSTHHSENKKASAVRSPRHLVCKNSKSVQTGEPKFTPWPMHISGASPGWFGIRNRSHRRAPGIVCIPTSTCSCS